jgi:hypothetical protein
MDGSVRAHLARTVDQVFALVSDPEFLRRRAEAAGEKNIVIQVNREGTLLKLRIERDLERNLPAFMKKMFSPTNHLVDVQTWQTAGDVKTSDWSVEISGQKRIDLRGRLSLAPAAGGGCDYVEMFSATVAIPLVGGRVEKYVLGETETSTRQQIEFLRAALERGGPG